MSNKLVEAPGELQDAVASLRAGDVERAQTIIADVLLADPSQGLALILSARAARLAGALDDAELLLARAGDVAGDHPQLVAEKGYLALARSNSAAAVKHFEHLTLLVPRLAEARFNLAHAYKECGRGDAAIAAYRRALELGISSPWNVHTEIGEVLAASRRRNDAREQFELALSLRPGFARALHGLGEISMARGDFDAAEDYFRSALRDDPGCAETCQRLAGTRRFSSVDDPDILAMQMLLETPSTPAYSLERLHFALGKAHDDCAAYEEAFRHYRTANDLKRSRVPAYDAAGWARHVSEVVDIVDDELFNAQEPRGSDDGRPIFIVGMPRSGLTLVEQIIAAHSQVESGGELQFFGNTCRTRLAPYPLALAQLDQQLVDDIVSDYKSALDERNSGGRLTDKCPENFLHLGLIARLFPNATLVHCRRNPLDTSLSVYFQDFPAGRTYANSLDDIAHYYQQYETIMAHWIELLGERLLEVQYEDLVIDPPALIRTILEHAGLAFEDQCLAPHSSVGDLDPLSSWQVRQPIYSTSLERWRDYADHIDALTAVIGAPA